jgi:hypothetical protein
VGLGYRTFLEVPADYSPISSLVFLGNNKLTQEQLTDQKMDQILEMFNALGLAHNDQAILALVTEGIFTVKDLEVGNS